MQRGLWGKPVIRRRTYYFFHYESIPSKRWFLIGLLSVRDTELENVRAALRTAREREYYWSEVHLSDLPRSFDGLYGAKARVARDWINAFQSGLANLAPFTVLAVDRHSPAYDPKRFPREYHAYNRFTAMALKAGIAWHLGPMSLDHLTVHFISDARDRVSRPDREWVDNFESYLPYLVTFQSRRICVEAVSFTGLITGDYCALMRISVFRELLKSWTLSLA
jgi:hypothetical protein